MTRKHEFARIIVSHFISKVQTVAPNMTQKVLFGLASCKRCNRLTSDINKAISHKAKSRKLMDFQHSPRPHGYRTRPN